MNTFNFRNSVWELKHFSTLWTPVTPVSMFCLQIAGSIYGHTTLNAPDLVWSRKLGRVGPGWHLDGRRISGSSSFGRLAGSEGLFCSESLSGLGIVPRPSVLREAIEFPKCHSGSFFFCNQDCLPRSFCHQLLVTRVEEQQQSAITWRTTTHSPQVGFAV